LSRICVATSKSRAYYALVSRLRRAGLPFSSILPDSDAGGCDVVLTTEDESDQFGARALVLERLDENPGIFKGQIVSRLGGEDDTILVGVDPGKRIGLAVFYGRTRLSFSTFESITAVSHRVGGFARAVPAGLVLIRVGNGNRSLATRLVDAFEREVPNAVVELVDESGTSVRTAKMKGIQKDQVAAAKIAFRKGDVVSQVTRNHG